MEQSTLIKIARLRTLAARHGKAFDVVRFATDRSFAQDCLTRVLDTDQEDLLLLGLEVMDALGMVRLKPSVVAMRTTAAPALVPVPAKPPAADRSQQYVGRLR
ncbi:MAG: hypothetical protein KA141_01010 [Rubrivivax sp.]|jgi:hypothetical protein|nr:hypothetical protein [Rubrivivax sp.]